MDVPQGAREANIASVYNVTEFRFNERLFSAQSSWPVVMVPHPVVPFCEN